MGKFSIRRHKQNLSDSATIVTVDPSISPSQRSYGSIISPRTRNRLHRSNNSSDETHDSPTDITKRPQRKLIKMFRQHQRSESVPDEGISVTPPEQKPHASSLPTTLNHPIGRGYSSQNWSENDIRPPRGWAPYSNMRGSVGSSADILLTPIRGSTAFSDDDFVLLPSGHALETENPDDIDPSQSDRCASPEPTIETLFTESEAHHTIAHEPLVVEDIVLQEPGVGPEPEPEPEFELGSESEFEAESEVEASPPSPPHIVLHQTGSALESKSELSESKPEPEPDVEPDIEPDVEQPEPESVLESEDSTAALSDSFTSEALTIVGVHPEDIPQIPAVILISQPKNVVERSPVDQIVAEPVLDVAPETTKPVAISLPPPIKPPVLVKELQRNIIPFPSDGETEVARHVAPTKVEARASTAALELYQSPSATWVVSAWQTASGIMLLATECFRWLARKGLRDDFRSCVSYWFLKELVIGFVLPLFLAPVALWWLFRTLYLHHDSTSVHF